MQLLADQLVGTGRWVTQPARMMAALQPTICELPGLMLLALVLLLAGCRSQEEAPILQLWEAPDFELLNFDRGSVSRSDLLGKIWVGAFIFTRCPGPCPLITQRMKEIQARLETDDTRLVSFTVDPEFDTPTVLTAYARQWSNGAPNWFFLTSEDPSELERVAAGFKVAAARVDTEADQIPDIVHGTHLFVVDKNGIVRSFVGSSSASSVPEVLHLIERLTLEE